jgi:N-acetylmuramoyl-L-alanine amidase
VIRSPLAREFVLSPNLGSRRGRVRPDMVILHYTATLSAAAARAWLCDQASQVSSHYLVDETGRITQMVGEDMRAWHAGASSWRGDADINSRSIGIEIQNPGHHLGYDDFPEAQMQAVTALCRDINSRHHIEPRHVLAHSDVAPGRKIDPGEKFDWRRLYQSGIGHWVQPSPATDGNSLRPGDQGEVVLRLQRMLADYGYGIALSGSYDRRTETVVGAFQRHFRPALLDGVADASTMATLETLLNSL